MPPARKDDPRFKSLLFDVDGTLLPSLDLWLEAYKEGLLAADRSLDDLEIIRVCFNRDFSAVAADLAIVPPETFGNRVEQHLQSIWSSMSIIPAALDALIACHGSGFQLGLVTSSGRERVLSPLEKINITHLFDVIVCGDDVTNRKPDPEPLFYALEALNADPATTLMIGDSEADLLAAQRASVSSALYLPPENERFYDVSVLRALHPTFVFTSYDQLLGYLNDVPAL